MIPHEAYQELVKRFKEIALLGSIGSVLGWDRETNMPRSGAQLRAQQGSYLAGMAHRMSTDPLIGEWLAVAESGDFAADPASDAAVNLREWRRDYERASKIPTELVEELSHLAVLAHQSWADARKQSNFAIFEPHLTRIVELMRRMAECIGYQETPYDALLEEYEPGITTAEVSALFSALRQDLVPLVQAIQASSRRPNSEILRRVYAVDRQKLLGQQASAAFGYDFRGGRIDTVTHPFCTGFGPGDVRITTRYNERYFNDAFFSILHETGHGLYEQGLSAEAFGTPLGQSVSLGIHESQSRLWENQVGRSRAYWRYFYPFVRGMYPETLGDVTEDDFYFAVNEVKPSYIRVDADEVTYPLHIMLRFEIEQAIITGELPVSDIPGVWNELFARYFGIAVPDDSQGCLQDVHWSGGGFGYFSTYALGTLYAAQIYDAAHRALPALDDQIGVGEFQPLLDWLRQQIHQQGRRFRSRALVERISGQSPTHQPYMAYLRTKYGELYAL